MGRPRKPTALLLSLEHNRGRNAGREHEPVPDGPLGEPSPFNLGIISDPAAIQEMYGDAWREISAALPEGVLTNADRWSVEIACTLMVEFRCHAIDRAGLGILTNLLGRLGMTPADRSKIIAPRKDKKENRFARLAQVKPIA